MAVSVFVGVYCIMTVSVCIYFFEYKRVQPFLK